MTQLFHRLHTWAKEVSPGVIRVGIDPFAVRLIGRPISAIFPPADTKMARHEAGFWLVDEAGPIPIRMPVSGLLVRVNRSLADHPGRVAEDPCGEGWLLEVECENAGAEMKGLMSSDEMEEYDRTEWERFRSAAWASVSRKKKPWPTLQDGGEPIDDFRRMLGPPKYRKLVMEFL